MVWVCFTKALREKRSKGSSLCRKKESGKEFLNPVFIEESFKTGFAFLPVLLGRRGIAGNFSAKPLFSALCNREKFSHLGACSMVHVPLFTFEF